MTWQSIILIVTAGVLAVAPIQAVLEVDYGSKALSFHLPDDQKEVSLLDAKQLEFSSLCIEFRNRVMEDMSTSDLTTAREVIELYRLLDEPMASIRKSIANYRVGCNKIRQYNKYYKEMFDKSQVFLLSLLEINEGEGEEHRKYMQDLSPSDVRCLTSDYLGRILGLCNLVFPDREHLEHLFSTSR